MNPRTHLLLRLMSYEVIMTENDLFGKVTAVWSASTKSYTRSIDLINALFLNPANIDYCTGGSLTKPHPVRHSPRPSSQP